MSVVVGHDGGTWVLADERFSRLGSERSHEWPGGDRADGFEVTPDGTVWTLTTKHVGIGPNERTVSRIRSFDGESWTLQKKMAGTLPANIWSSGRNLTVAPDGSVWAAWADPDGERKQFGHGPTVIARFGADG